MKKAIGYIRRSTQGQADNFSAEDQRQVIQSYANANEFEIIDWKEDIASGATEVRPAFDELMAADNETKFDAVIVAKIDRVARDVNIYFYFKFVMKRKGAELISANEMEDFGAFGAFAPILETTIAVFAEIERKRIADRMQGGRSQKAKGGTYAGGKAPFGYKAENGELVPYEKEVEQVKQIFKLREQGESLNAIAQDVGTGRNGKIMTASTIKSILDNREFYQGKYSYSNIKGVNGTHQKIL